MEIITNQISPKKSKTKQNIIAIIILIVGVILAFAIFGPKKAVEEETVPPAKAVVETVVLGEEGSQTAELEKTVTLQSDRSADAVSEYSGRIRWVNFEVGKYVYQGSTLATFDQSETENAAKNSLETAEESLKLAKKNLKETKDMLEDLVDDGDEASKILVNSAKIQKEQAELAVEQAKVAYGKTFIKAPVSGTVVSKNVSVNDYVTAGSVVAHISGGGKLEATVSLNAQQIKRISPKDEVKIVVAGETAKGKIIAQSKVADSNGRFEVKVQAIDGLDCDANQSAKVIFTLSLDVEKQDSFFIPLNSVTIGQRKSEVFVLQDGKAVSREVETGEVIGSKVEIVSGLSTGEEVIIKNGKNLQDGQEVEIKK